MQLGGGVNRSSRLTDALGLGTGTLNTTDEAAAHRVLRRHTCWLGVMLGVVQTLALGAIDTAKTNIGNQIGRKLHTTISVHSGRWDAIVTLSEQGSSLLHELGSRHRCVLTSVCRTESLINVKREREKKKQCAKRTLKGRHFVFNTASTCSL